MVGCNGRLQMALLFSSVPCDNICDVTCQNQTNVGICHLPEIKFQNNLKENITFYAD